MRIVNIKSVFNKRFQQVLSTSAVNKRFQQALPTSVSNKIELHFPQPHFETKQDYEHQAVAAMLSRNSVVLNYARHV